MPNHRAPFLVHIPPPVLYAATFVIGIGLDRVMPWGPAWTRISGLHWLGAALILAGVALGAVSAGRFVFRRTTLIPTGTARRLVTNGPYAWSRNPMYVGLTVIYLGAALALGAVWPLPLLALPWAIMNWVMIPFEEARLRSIFGKDYEGYCGRVRRWV